MPEERKTVCFDTEYPLYCGLYKSLIQYIDVDDIISPPRPAVSRSAVATFSRSLSKTGFLRPIFLVSGRRIADGRKRYAAALSLGAERVPCMTSPTPLVFEDDLLIMKLRTEQLSIFESADVLSVLTNSYLYSQEEVAAALGRSQSFVANRLRLLSFSAEERAIIEDGGLTERHCRAVLKIKDAATRRRALEAVASSSMTVGATEEFVSSVAASGLSDGAKLRRDLDSLIGSCPDTLDVSSSSSVTADGTVIYTIKIPR